MELSSFSENIVTETFERNGESLELKINRDALVPEYFDAITERLKPTLNRLDGLMKAHEEMRKDIKSVEDATKKGSKPKKSKSVDLVAMVARMREAQKEIAEISREVFAERLTCPVVLPDGLSTCLLKGWDMTDKGNPVPASKETLLRLPAPAVEALFDFVMAKTETVKKKVESEIKETSENTPDGSPGLRVVGQNG